MKQTSYYIITIPAESKKVVRIIMNWSNELPLAYRNNIESSQAIINVNFAITTN